MSEWTHTLDGERCRLLRDGGTKLPRFVAVEWEADNGDLYDRIPLATWQRAIPIPQPIERTIKWLPIEVTDSQLWQAPADCLVLSQVGTLLITHKGGYCRWDCTHYALIEGTLP